MTRTSGPCDLHIHSWYSDGTSSPTELVEKAESCGLAAVSVTDHDTLEGQSEAIEAGERLGVDVLEGIEFSVRIEGADTHILGYCIDVRDGALNERIAMLAEARVDRAREIVRRLRAEGLALSFDRVLERAGGGTIGRPHIAAELVEGGFVQGFQSAFGRYIGEGRPCYVEKTVLSLEEVVSLVRGAGGVAVWAHPGARIGDGEMLERMLGAGIGGIEAFHPNHDPATAQSIVSAAKDSGLIVTGGSDFHFYEAKHVDIGDVTVPYSAVTALRSAVI